MGAEEQGLVREKGQGCATSRRGAAVGGLASCSPAVGYLDTLGCFQSGSCHLTQEVFSVACVELHL